MEAYRVIHRPSISSTTNLLPCTTLEAAVELAKRLAPDQDFGGEFAYIAGFNGETWTMLYEVFHGVVSEYKHPR